jgi:hypothetical protein|tara:strand:+ start:51 stop:743 length:693 start_codon:yes stop_codon:yes gene_type:complete
MFFILILIFLPLSLNSQPLSFDLSSYEVTLKNNKKNNLTIFGYNKTKDLLVLKIVGPNQKVILQKKTKFLNMWTWKKSGEFSYPSLFHYYTNFKSEDIDFRVKKDLVDNIKLVGKDDDNLKKDLIEKKMTLGLFYVKNNSFKSIEKNNQDFFKIPIKLPYNSLAGKYEISMEVFKEKKLVSKKSKFFFVQKPGLNSFIYKFAHNFSFLYGLVSVIVAIALGVGAGFIFRK